MAQAYVLKLDISGQLKTFEHQGLGASDMPVLWKIISGVFGDLK
jgi:hypothetical protein